MGESMQIVHKSPKLTLAWDPPQSDFPNRSTQVISYQVYFRDHGTTEWYFLDEVEGVPHPEYTIDHMVLGNGQYDFAVQATLVGGQSSPLHTSLDSSANPVSGWYVLWANSN